MSIVLYGMLGCQKRTRAIDASDVLECRLADLRESRIDAHIAFEAVSYAIDRYCRLTNDHRASQNDHRWGPVQNSIM